jgi:acetyl-CoA synthetase
MGRPLPGYEVRLLGPDGSVAEREGEICISVAQRPVGVTRGYDGDDTQTSHAMRDGHYHTGDLASRDEEGYLVFIGRTDDVFKASDYRLSPFELENVLLEHPSIVEAAVVPSADPVRHAVPKAFVVLAAGVEATRDTAADIFLYCRKRLAPYKRIRRLEFSDLPKTASGKIRRVELRALETRRRAAGERAPLEFFEEDLQS